MVRVPSFYFYLRSNNIRKHTGIQWRGGNIRHKYKRITFYLAFYLQATPLNSLHARITSNFYTIAACI